MTFDRDNHPPEGFGIDMMWLKESLQRLGWKGAGAFLRSQYGVGGNSVSEMVPKLTKDQAEEFVDEVDRRLGGLR